jgi:2-oxoglutarate ferredoxin oxidoreductase subunit delta
MDNEILSGEICNVSRGEGVGNASKKKRRAKIEINRDFCKGCGICVAFCPKRVLELDENEKVVVKRIEDCSACRLCELRCPDIAIEVQAEQSEPTAEEKSEKEGAGSIEQGAVS